MRSRNYLDKSGIWQAIGNFLLNFGIAIVWLGRWTIRILRRLLGKGRG